MALGFLRLGSVVGNASSQRLSRLSSDQSRKLLYLSAVALGGLLVSLSREGRGWQMIFSRLVGSLAFFGAFLVFIDVLLGLVVAKVIMRWAKVHHKNIVWSIERVCIRPSFHSWQSGSSKIIVMNFTWHNPLGFGTDDDSYIMKINCMTFNLTLWSIWKAVRCKQAIDIELLMVEGLRFKTQRNELSALNLWEALDLPDDDVNVRAIMEKCKQHGGLREQQQQQEHQQQHEQQPPHSQPSAIPKSVSLPQAHKVSPLPAAASEATRKASRFQKSIWAKQAQPNQEWSERLEGLAGFLFPCCVRTKADVVAPDPVFRANSGLAGASPKGSMANRLFGGDLPEGYVELPIGDPRRRPRWGVPVRFNIQSIVILQLELWMLDILMSDSHETLHEPDEARMELPSLVVFRERLEADDERRAGSQDGIHGVYLGELVWVLIAEALYKLASMSPSSLLKHAILATGYTLEDMAVSVAARTVEQVVNAKHTVEVAAASIGNQLAELSEYVYYDATEGLRSEVCRLHVHLILGRHMTFNKSSVNVHAELQLLEPSGTMGWKAVHDDVICSAQRMWTKTPDWYERMVLSPVVSMDCHLHIQCFHTTESVVDSEKILIGEVFLPIDTLRNLQSAESIDKEGDIVGWFPLTTDSAGMRAKHRCSGELKLGLRLEGLPPNSLQNKDSVPDFQLASSPTADRPRRLAIEIEDDYSSSPIG